MLKVNSEQGLVNDVRTIIQRQTEYIHIPDLNPQT